MIRHPRHLRFIRQLPCCCCGLSAPSQAAHIRMGSCAGLGQKPDDSRVVPMCWQCHHHSHQIPEREFWAKRGLDPLHLADLLWEDSGDSEKAIRAITDWRLGRAA